MRFIAATEQVMRRQKATKAVDASGTRTFDLLFSVRFSLIYICLLVAVSCSFTASRFKEELPTNDRIPRKDALFHRSVLCSKI